MRNYNTLGISRGIDDDTMEKDIEKVIKSVVIPFRVPKTVKVSKSLDDKEKIKKKYLYRVKSRI